MTKRWMRFVLCCLVALGLATLPLYAQDPLATARPRVIVIGVNGAEWDIIRPLVLHGEMPNLASVMARGVSGKLRTVSAPTCPKTYTILQTSTPTEENGISGFVVDGRRANSHMLKTEPLWSILSKHGVTVGMANVPATFPVLPVRGYMISGMLTPGRHCESGVLCAPKLSEVGDEAVFPEGLKRELLSEVGDFWIDCSRMPNREELAAAPAPTIKRWLSQVQEIRERQLAVFEHLLRHHPTDFTFFVQSCEDRVGHWLYPIQAHNAGYDQNLHTVAVEAFPDQYRAFDRVLGRILQFVDENTTLFILSDHGIKPLREREPNTAQADPGYGAPIIAKHDFEDGDEVPGIFVASGPGIRKGERVPGLSMSLFDIAPTILKIYGITSPKQMRGRVLSEIFERRSN